MAPAKRTVHPTGDPVVRWRPRAFVKRLLRRYGYDLVRLSGPSTPRPDLEFPVDFDDETIATVRSVQGYTMTSPERIHALCHALRYIVASGIQGDVVECGVWKGGSMMAAARTLLRLGDTGRHLYLFDTFAGMPKPTADDIDFAGVSALDEWERFHLSSVNAPARADLQTVRQALGSVGYPEPNIHFVKGMVEDTLAEHAPASIALLRVDTDYYESTLHELRHLYPRLARGGILIVDDYGHFRGARKAVDEYFAPHEGKVLLHRIDYSGRLVVKP
jgi:hypothetical protein